MSRRRIPQLQFSGFRSFNSVWRRIWIPVFLSIVLGIATGCSYQGNPSIVLDAIGPQSAMVCASIQTPDSLLDATLGGGKQAEFSILAHLDPTKPLAQQTQIVRANQLSRKPLIPILFPRRPGYHCIPNALPGEYAIVFAYFTLKSSNRSLLLNEDSIRRTIVKVEPSQITLIGPVQVIGESFSNTVDLGEAQRQFQRLLLDAMEKRGVSRFHLSRFEMEHAWSAKAAVVPASTYVINDFKEFLDEHFAHLGWNSQIDRFKVEHRRQDRSKQAAKSPGKE